MTGIEFLPDDHGAHGSDEELAAGPRRPLPRWLVIVVAAALAVAAVSYAVAQGDNQPTPSVRASSSSQPSRAATIRIPPDDNFGSALAISAGQPVLAVAVSLSNTWVLQSGAVDLVHPNLTAAIPDPPLDVDASATARLLVDPTVNRLWIVVLGDLPGRVLEYEADRVQLVRDIRSISPINAAAALNGHLYLTSGDRLLDVAPGRSPHLAARLPALRAGVVADVDHGRLLANDYGSPSHI